MYANLIDSYIIICYKIIISILIKNKYYYNTNYDYSLHIESVSFYLRLYLTIIYNLIYILYNIFYIIYTLIYN